MTLAFFGKLNPLRGIKDPSSDTIAEVGQYYLNIKTNELFLCTEKIQDNFIWKPILDLALWDLLSNYQMDFSSRQELHQHVAAIADFLHGLEIREFTNTTYNKFNSQNLTVFGDTVLLPDGIAYNFKVSTEEIIVNGQSQLINKYSYISSYIAYSDYNKTFDITTPIFKVQDRPNEVAYIMQWGILDSTSIYLDVYQSNNRIIANIGNYFEADNYTFLTNSIDIISGHAYYVNYKRDNLYYYIDIYDATIKESHVVTLQYNYHGVVSHSNLMLFGADSGSIEGGNNNNAFWYDSLDFNTFKVIIGDEEIVNCTEVLENTAEINTAIANQKYKALNLYGKDIINKYTNIQDLSDIALKALIIENGYEYITAVIDLTSIQLRNIVYYLPLIHSLKGTKTGLEIILACITGKAIVTEWWEDTLEIEDSPGNYKQELPYTYKVTLLDLYEQELPPKLFSTLIRYSSEYVFPLLRELTIRVTNEIDPLYFYLVCEVTNEYTAQLNLDYIIDGQQAIQPNDKELDGQWVEQPVDLIVDAGSAND